MLLKASETKPDPVEGGLSSQSVQDSLRGVIDYD